MISIFDSLLRHYSTSESLLQKSKEGQKNIQREFVSLPYYINSVPVNLENSLKAQAGWQVPTKP